jgi:hypothetical protein
MVSLTPARGERLPAALLELRKPGEPVARDRIPGDHDRLAVDLDSEADRGPDRGLPCRQSRSAAGADRDALHEVS